MNNRYIPKVTQNQTRNPFAHFANFDIEGFLQK